MGSNLFNGIFVSLFGNKGEERKIQDREICKKRDEKVINAPSGKKYLGEFLDSLPPNTLINKETTGVGATTMALESDSKYIIAVPYQSLALNKKKWCEQRGIDILVVKSGVSKEEISEFEGSKILVVFDSLWKVAENLKCKSDFRLMVDEVHVVLTSAHFRGNGMSSLLANFRKFKDFVLITATPTPELYNLKEFKNIEKIRISWPDKEKIRFIRDVVTLDDDYTIIDKIKLLSIQHIEGEIKSNAYFFVNSISIINKVLKPLIKQKKISAHQVNLIVAEGNNSRLKVNLGKSFSIGIPPSLDEEPKKLNFITSTAFEGSDFYDENGKIYIISDGSRSHTKIDIQTQLHQIAGRIRNSKLNKSIHIITVPTPIDFLTTDKASFEASVTKNYKDEENYLIAQKKIIEENASDEVLCERVNCKLLSDAETNPFYIESKGGFVEMNELYIPSQMHYWNIINQSYIYTINTSGQSVISDGLKCGVEFIDDKIKLPAKAIGKAKLGLDYNFKELMKLYLKYLKEEENEPLQFINGECTKDNFMSTHIAKIEPLIPKAYQILKRSGIENLNFSKTKILLAIDEKAPINNVAKHLKIKQGWYSSRDIKLRLQKFYNRTNPNLKAKGADIFKYYVASYKSKRVAGNLIRGVFIEQRKRVISN